jgi:hypothetical protein
VCVCWGLAKILLTSCPTKLRLSGFSYCPKENSPGPAAGNQCLDCRGASSCHGQPSMEEEVREGLPAHLAQMLSCLGILTLVLLVSLTSLSPWPRGRVEAERHRMWERWAPPGHMHGSWYTSHHCTVSSVLQIHAPVGSAMPFSGIFYHNSSFIKRVCSHSLVMAEWLGMERSRARSLGDGSW